MRESLGRWWRRWSPWVLRARIDTLQADIWRIDTETEQTWRYLAATLDGLADPATYALRYSVEGSTLVVDRRDLSL